MLASLGCATLLAWLFSKPIRNLHSALSDAAAGNLDIRVADRMGPGDDELKDLGVEFDRMIGRLQAMISAQRRLLNDVSHEIRSPMARIQAAIGVAHQQPEQALPMLERIERESIRVDRLVGELLALSRLQAGVDTRYARSSTCTSCSPTSSMMRASRRAPRGARSAPATRSTAPYAATSSCCGVRWRTWCAMRSSTAIARHRGRGDAARPWRRNREIAVQDSGTGVPEADLVNIFDPFFRSSTHARKEGSGLGSEIAKRVIESHGGTIRAANVPAGGLRVVIELPLLP